MNIADQLRKMTLADIARIDKRGMYIGMANIDPLLLFYWLDGYIWNAKTSEQKQIKCFISHLYTKFPSKTSHGWYHNLNQITRNKRKSVDLFFSEYLRYMEVGAN